MIIKEAKRRHKLARKFIHDSINIDMLYERFLNMISDMNYGVKSYDTKNKMSMSKRYSGQGDESRFMSISDLDVSNHNRLINAFREIYPNFYHSIEKYLSKNTFDFGWELYSIPTIFKVKIDCDHEFRPIQVYRDLRAFYQCVKCQNIANENVSDKLKPSQDKDKIPVTFDYSHRLK